jgi:hypothetical protein
MSLIIGTAVAGGGTAALQVSRSLRFNPADTAYLSRTPGSASNRRTWTWSGWVKGSGPTSTMFSASNGAAGALYSRFGGNGAGIDIGQFNTVADFSLYTNAVTRDYSAWYHIVIAVDTTQATSTNRVRIYINAVEQTSLVGTYPTLNQDLFMNTTNAHAVGRFENVGQYLNGYQTEINFIDGQQLTPSAFGETDTNTGVWKPKIYTGTYGTNGYELSFADNSGATSTTLGKDTSGNGNNWTPNNFSVTAGAGNDSLVDTPTNYGTDTGVGGEVRGNYCTLNPLNVGATPTNGNLDLSGGDKSSLGTIGFPSTGKWYFEMTCGTGVTTTSLDSVGIGNIDVNGTIPANKTVYMYRSSGVKYSIINGGAASQPAYGATFVNGDVIGVAFDCDAGTLTFYKNGVSQGQAFNSILSTTPNSIFYPTLYARGSGGTSNISLNAGQRAFAYTAPSGFKALCTQNLPTPTIGSTSTTLANDYFDVNLYTGNGSSQSIVNSGGFQPDFVWYKSRSSGVFNHGLFDVIRGTSKQLFSNSSSAEGTFSGVTAFNSNGFSVGSDNGGNENGGSMVAWQWNAGGSTVTNTTGSISAQVRANTTSGFSIVTYTGTGSAATIGHGLGVAPSMIIVKNRQAANSWAVYHISTGANQQLLLNSTNGISSDTQGFTAVPSSTVFSVGTGAAMDTNQTSGGGQHVAYCFAPVASYSSFGSYVGNANSDGPFIYTGFRPEFIMIKATSSTGDWVMEDAARSPSNVSTNYLVANATTAEQTGQLIDFVSNGFKIRVAVSGAMNSSGVTYIYAAFAETPFKYSLAR